VPLKTAHTCAEILDVAKIVAEKGNVNSITDAAVSALMAKAGVQGAILNVIINLGSIKDEKFVNKLSSELEDLQRSVDKKTSEILKIVNSKM
jgi:formiminotetrahydrofolate cyclodeaminase